MNSTPVAPCCCALHVQPAHLSWQVWGKLFHHLLIQILTIQSNSPFSPWIDGQCKKSLLAWISDNKCTFFGLKRNPSRVIFYFWGWTILPSGRTCSWLPNSVEYLWLFERWIKRWTMVIVHNRYIAEQNYPRKNSKCQAIKYLFN